MVYEFTRSTCEMFIPQPPRSAWDFIIPFDMDPTWPVNTYILPPMRRDAAMQAIAYVSSSRVDFGTAVTTRRGPLTSLSWSLHIPRQEGFIDLAEHEHDLVCAVYLREDGVYEVVQSFSIVAFPMIRRNTLIFAPSAWEGGAEVLFREGQVSAGGARLDCVLRHNRFIQLHVNDSFVASFESGGPSLREDQEDRQPEAGSDGTIDFESRLF
ncbi:hypothetical protein B0H16DRAFT_1465175 [Mycena metata]|uniref:Uncharacterized protein n=1 Tax=Mycena metata TaxID=1033252 RepID=A0AAD7MZ69_9AGAR|nr:hypothetical protein B0H16DRAFT_1465175 [Mycena metata]